MKEKSIVLKQLDRQMNSEAIRALAIIPKQGWIRTVRKAIGMTVNQLAARLGVNPSRLSKIESSEPDGAITVKTLASVAEKLNCKLVYTFVPKTSFEGMVKDQAKKVALKKIERTAHTMKLEDQAVDINWQKEQLEDLSRELLCQSWKHLWEE